MRRKGTGLRVWQEKRKGFWGYQDDRIIEVEARNNWLVLSGSSEGVYRARFGSISFRPEITQQTATCYLSSSEQIQYHDAQLFKALGLHANHLYTISRNT
jgi:hypothetical protein